MLKLRFRFVLFLLVIALLGTGMYMQYLEDPGQTPLPESLRGPFDRMKALLGEQGGSLQQEIDALASEIELYLRAYDDAAPEGYKRMVGHIDTEDASPASQSTTTGRQSGYATPANALPEVKRELETMLDTIDFSQAPELKQKAFDLYSRVSENIRENAGSLKEATVGEAHSDEAAEN